MWDTTDFEHIWLGVSFWRQTVDLPPIPRGCIVVGYPPRVSWKSSSRAVGTFTTKGDVVSKSRLNHVIETLLGAAAAPTVTMRGRDVVDPMLLIGCTMIHDEISTASMDQNDDAVTGLSFDAQMVRSRITPSIAALTGKWFWWPTDVRPRSAPKPWPNVTLETTA